MTDHPIIFSAPMIRALLDGRKTMTRRLAFRDGKPAAKASFLREGRWVARSSWLNVIPGDRLWVRESGAFECQSAPIYRADGEQGGWKWFPSIHMPRWASRLTLTVTATKIERLRDISDADARAEGMAFFDHGFNQYRQQRNGWHADHVEASIGADYCLGSARHAFGNLWEKLHGAGSWNANPEVVALTFTVHKTNIDALPKLAA